MFDHDHQIKILLFAGRSVGRPASLMFVLVLLAACTSIVKTTHVSENTRTGAMSMPGDMSREQMFDALSSHEWCTQPASPPGTSSRVILLRDGRQNVMHSDDDYSMMRPAGSWNFAKLGPREGVLYIGSDDNQVTRILLFRFVSHDELELVNAFSQLPHGTRSTHFRCQPLSTLPTRTSNELPLLDLGSSWKQLAGTRWRMNSELSFDYSVTAIEFETHGTVLVSLPPAECSEATRWNRYYGWPVAALMGHSCIKRTPFDAGEFRLTRGVLVHRREPYLRENDISDTRRFWLAFDVARLEGTVTYVPPLWTSPRHFQIELWGDGIRRLSGASLAITQFGGDAGSGGRDLATIPLQGALSPAGTVLLDVTIADFPSNPPDAPVALDFSLRTPGGPTEFITLYYTPKL